MNLTDKQIINYKISIIIPIHNINKYLEQTLNSLLNQSIGYENIEVIMINDCSTDSSGEIIDKYADKYENFIAIHLPENSGLPGKPRNIGLERATGEYVMFMDHDDYYSNDACEIFYNKIAAENADVVFSRFNYVFISRKVQHNPTLFGDVDEIKVNTINENERLLEVGPTIWTKIFRRKFIIENNIWFPEGMLAEDLSFVVNAFLKAKGIIYLNNYFSYNYRIRDSDEEKSTIYIRNKKYLMAMIMGYYDTYNILKNLKKEEYFPIIFKGHLQYWMDCFISSDAAPTEKKELLEKIAFLFKEQNKYGVKLDEKYLPLAEDIVNKEFDRAILRSEVMADFKKRENELYGNQEVLQKQIAELQTVKGYLNYKIRNIAYRVKRRIKI